VRSNSSAALIAAIPYASAQGELTHLCHYDILLSTESN
jgi:hypothetical protein